MSRRQLVENRVGSMAQLAGVRSYEFNTGKARGMRALEVNNGSGLRFTVLADRGMDLGPAEYRGTNLTFLSKTGLVAPCFYDSHGDGFLEGFGGGLLTTCGLTYMGAPCIDQGEELGMHGRISNCPAEAVNVEEGWQDGDYRITISGRVRQARFFKENLVLDRRITTRMGADSIWVRDTVTNCGFERQPLMLLYHCNFGYPLLDEGSVLVTSGGRVVPRDEDAQRGLGECFRFQAPTHGYREQVFYHVSGERRAFGLLYNEKLDGGLGAYVRYDTSQLPYLLEWKQMGEGDYVVGMEPATWLPEGRSAARSRGELDFIGPGEERRFEIELGVTRGLTPPEDLYGRNGHGIVEAY